MGTSYRILNCILLTYSIVTNVCFVVVADSLTQEVRFKFFISFSKYDYRLFRKVLYANIY